MNMTRRSLIVGGFAAAATATARSLFGQQSFRGRYAGQEREIDGVAICWCPPGAFVMGSPRGEPERRADEDQVRVTLTRGFWIAKYETTQGQWHRISGDLPGAPTSQLPAGTSYPVGNVNFAETEAFCRQLTLRSRRLALLPDDWEFRLPTEAQWEYACRAGSTTATAFGDSLSSKNANFSGSQYNGAERGPALRRAAPVGRYPANAWGVHDMHGNTYEWCRDWYHAKLPGGSDPDMYTAHESAARNRDGTISRVRRGGGWLDDGWACRSAARFRFEAERRYDHIGFRIVAVET
jgi:formylglycine-generating enzyme